MMDLRATNKGAEPAAGTPGLSPPALRGGGRGRGRAGERSGGRGGLGGSAGLCDCLLQTSVSMSAAASHPPRCRKHEKGTGERFGFFFFFPFSSLFKINTASLARVEGFRSV